MEMGMNWARQGAIIALGARFSFALICKFISAFLIAYICVFLGILLSTGCWFPCELLS